jgi:hypothetical protein
MNFYDSLAWRWCHDVSRTRRTRRRTRDGATPDDHATDTTHHMSTRPNATAERAAPPVDESTQLPDRDARSGPPPADSSWVARCQCQFSTTDTTRLANLADDDNEAMPDGV